MSEFDKLDEELLNLEAALSDFAGLHARSNKTMDELTSGAAALQRHIVAEVEAFRRHEEARHESLATSMATAYDQVEERNHAQHQHIVHTWEDIVHTWEELWSLTMRTEQASASATTEMRGTAVTLGELSRTIADKLVAEVEGFKRQGKAEQESLAESLAAKHEETGRRNQAQFHVLADAWVEQAVLATATVEANARATAEVRAATATLTELSSKLRAMVDADSALPVRLDKMDSTIATSLLVTQGLQSRFDVLNQRLEKMTDGMVDKVKSQSALAEAETRTALKHATEEAAVAVQAAKREICEEMAGTTKRLAEQIAIVGSQVSDALEKIEGSEKRAALLVGVKAAAFAIDAVANQAAVQRQFDKVTRRMVVIASILALFLLATLGIELAIWFRKGG